MRINELSVSTVVAMKRAVVAVGLIGLGLLGITPLALANSNESSDVVAPYLHIAAATATATGPYTTHLLVSSRESASPVNVTVKCYNDSSQRVGPAAGTTFPVAFHGMVVVSPISLGLTTDGLFTGIGWCYFHSNSTFDIAVGFLMGVSEGNNLITTNNSVGIVADTAQSTVSTNDANIPYWTNEGSWVTYLLALNPTATARTMTVGVYNAAAGLLSSGAIVGFSAARDLAVVPISTSTTFGSADIDITGTGRGFAGWVLGFNFASYESFMYQVPQDNDDISDIVSTDRP